MLLRRFATVTVVLIIIFWFLTAGSFLVVNQHPVRSSVIIVLGGGTGERELQASKLYRGKYATYVILSDGGARWHPSTVEAEMEIGWLKTYGVPGTAIIPELHAQSTYGNAIYTKSIMIQHDFRSAIVVSSSYHMRRAQYIFDKVYSGSHIKLTFSAAPVPRYNPSLWWTTQSGWNYVPGEYIKLAGYIIWYGILH